MRDSRKSIHTLDNKMNSEIYAITSFVRTVIIIIGGLVNFLHICT